MPRNDNAQNEQDGELPPGGSLLCGVSRSSDQSSPSEVRMDLTVLAQAIKDGVQKAMADQDSLIDYPELARRMRLRERFVRRLKNAGVIHAALDLGKVVRFHWPSVLAELKVAGARNGRQRPI